jgi:hypothetical protein
MVTAWTGTVNRRSVSSLSSFPLNGPAEVRWHAATEERRMPDPDGTIPDTHATRKSFSDFYAFAAAHDPDLAARGLAAHEVSDTLDAVAVLRTWLQRYADALHRRR